MHSNRLIHRTRHNGLTIEVRQSGNERSLYFGTPMKQSSMLIDEPLTLILPYTRYMMTVLAFQPAPINILLIGLGGGSLVRFLLHHYPACQLHVVEKNAEVARIAREYFQLGSHPRLRVHIDDGIQFMRRTQADAPFTYDLILVDAFDSEGIAPELQSNAFFPTCRTRLNPGGVAAFNFSRKNSWLYDDLRHLIEDAFSEQLLQLPVGISYNTILLGLNETIPWSQWKELRNAALRESNRLDLELSRNLDTIYRVNQPFWRRLFRPKVR